MTHPNNFRRDREWPCPACGVPQHSVVQLQLHYARHTPEEKEAAWAKVPAFWESKRQVFGLVPVSLPMMRDAEAPGIIRMDQS